MTHTPDKASFSRLSLLVVLVPVVCLVPFVGKPFHVDDIPFLWEAQQIHKNVVDFQGFTANWYGTELPMFFMNKNPPLVSYFIALTARIVGWREVALHGALLVLAVATSLGTFVLARSFSTRPELSTLIAVLSPGFLVSSTTLMCEPLMIALYVWAAALWVRGLEKNQWAWLGISGFLIGMSGLTKYFGMTLVPLLFLYSLALKEKVGNWVWFLLIPIAMLAGYELWTYRLYGLSLLSDAMTLSAEAGQLLGGGPVTKTLTGLSFTGGCLAATAFFAPWIWGRRVVLPAVVLFLLVLAVLLGMGTVGRLALRGPEGIRWELAVQLALLVVAGVHVLAIAGATLIKRRDASSAMLFFWILGTFVFSTYLNWSVNARTIIPMIPAAGIAVVRRWEDMHPSGEIGTSRWAFAPLVPAACLALAVTYADWTLAQCQRTGAQAVSAYLRGYPQAVWFQGHWGFQYYMEAEGGKPVDFENLRFEPGQVVVVPSNNCNMQPLSPEYFVPVETLRVSPCGWLGTMQREVGAGFYSDVWGPMPFAFARIDPEAYALFLVGPFSDPQAAVNRFREDRDKAGRKL